MLLRNYHSNERENKKINNISVLGRKTGGPFIPICPEQYPFHSCCLGGNTKNTLFYSQSILV